MIGLWRNDSYNYDNEIKKIILALPNSVCCQIPVIRPSYQQPTQNSMYTTGPQVQIATSSPSYPSSNIILTMRIKKSFSVEREGDDRR